MWLQTYQDGITHVQGMCLWLRVNRLGVLPPPSRRGNQGRPNNHDRRKSMFETSSSSRNTILSRHNRVMTCSNCKEEVHNKLGCKNQRAQSPLKKLRGQPRKAQEPRSVFFRQGQPLQAQSEGLAFEGGV